MCLALSRLAPVPQCRAPRTVVWCHTAFYRKGGSLKHRARCESLTPDKVASHCMEQAEISLQTPPPPPPNAEHNGRHTDVLPPPPPSESKLPVRVTPRPAPTHRHRTRRSSGVLVDRVPRLSEAFLLPAVSQYCTLSAPFFFIEGYRSPLGSSCVVAYHGYMT